MSAVAECYHTLEVTMRGFVFLGLVDYATILKKATGPEPVCRLIDILSEYSL